MQNASKECGARAYEDGSEYHYKVEAHAQHQREEEAVNEVIYSREYFFHGS
tara:strand:+ start:263 stop:415 length:153 start_codon:yes stop_codon:yes gene_type:complete